jgi:hypothetical protein
VLTRPWNVGESSFKHLMPEHIRDANKRRPGEPGYNPETLYIPPNWFTTWKVRQPRRAAKFMLAGVSVFFL